SRRRHTRSKRDWSSDVCSSDLLVTHYNELINQLKLSHAQREKLVTNLSHELRTPVANLQGYLYALKTRTIEGDSELFESLYLEANRLTSMIEQIDQINDLNS